MITEDEAISPLDGRYRNIVSSLSEYFSDFALYKNRLLFEIKYLIFFLKTIKKPINHNIEKKLLDLVSGFDSHSLGEIKDIEKVIHHDVKAVEYYLQSEITKFDPDLIPYIHFGLTSEDTNSISYGWMIQGGLSQVIIPKLNEVILILENIAFENKNMAMLARTHGQAAVGTTFGKEILVFIIRIKKELNLLKKLSIEAKISGAVGNFNALNLALPNIKWIEKSNEFIKSLGLTPNHFTTQIVPFDSYVKIFQSISLINSILIGLSQDLWRYVSDDYVKQKVVGSEVGSSTMPQKVNPIDFENSEGNLGIANSLFNYFSMKLPISRLQRDLSDSTVKRNIGPAFGYSLIGYHSLIRGLKRIVVNKELLIKDLDNHWEIVGEGIQTILRLEGQPQAYEELKKFSRGKKLDQKAIKKFISNLKISKKSKKILNNLTPNNYLGLAEKLVNKYKEGYEK